MHMCSLTLINPIRRLHIVWSLLSSLKFITRAYLMLLFSQNTTLELSTLQILELQSCSWAFPPSGLLPLAVCINRWERSNLSRNDVSDYLGRQRGDCPRSKELGLALPHSFCLKCWRFKNTYMWNVFFRSGTLHSFCLVLLYWTLPHFTGFTWLNIATGCHLLIIHPWKSINHVLGVILNSIIGCF